MGRRVCAFARLLARAMPLRARRHVAQLQPSFHRAVLRCDASSCVPGGLVCRRSRGVDQASTAVGGVVRERYNHATRPARRLILAAAWRNRRWSRSRFVWGLTVRTLADLDCSAWPDLLLADGQRFGGQAWRGRRSRSSAKADRVLPQLESLTGDFNELASVVGQEPAGFIKAAGKHLVVEIEPATNHFVWHQNEFV